MSQKYNPELGKAKDRMVILTILSYILALVGVAVVVTWLCKALGMEPKTSKYAGYLAVLLIVLYVYYLMQKQKHFYELK